LWGFGGGGGDKEGNLIILALFGVLLIDSALGLGQFLTRLGFSVVLIKRRKRKKGRYWGGGS